VGTVREDYSANGNAWSYLPHDHARSRVYRWNEDGIAVSATGTNICALALALWNGRDPILKERLFGLSSSEGNHGERRQGVLLLPGQHTDTLVHEISLQIPAGRISVRKTPEGEPAATKLDTEYELVDTGSSIRAAISMSSLNTPRPSLKIY